MTRRLAKPSLVELANEQVSIVEVCHMLGVDAQEWSERSRKVRCPFGDVYHSDHGVAPAMRVYPETNSAYCFSCQIYLSPVGMAARAMDCDERTAAARLLDRVGYRPPDLASRWRDAVQHEPLPDKTLLADALKTFCRRTAPGWDRLQFAPQVASALSRCLAILDLVQTADDALTWLSRCKQAMTVTLKLQSSGVSQRDDVLLSAMRDREEERR